MVRGDGAHPCITWVDLATRVFWVDQASMLSPFSNEGAELTAPCQKGDDQASLPLACAEFTDVFLRTG